MQLLKQSNQSVPLKKVEMKYVEMHDTKMFTRLPTTEYNNHSFSIAWKINDKPWKTYYRKFHLMLFKYDVLRGQYISNLHFDEDIDLCKNNVSFMIYSMSSDTLYKEIKEIFDQNNFNKFAFYNVFVFTKEEWIKRKSDLNYSQRCYQRLINENNNLLELQIYKGYSTHKRNDKVYGITFPSFRIKLSTMILKVDNQNV